MQEFNLLALIEAGQIKSEDDALGLIQNISQENAHNVARWLVMATGGPVELRLIGIGEVEEIRYTPEDVAKAIQRPANAKTDEG
jgi:hypothetical protein